MEMTSICIYGTIGALLCLIIGAMLGYARYESQQQIANALQRAHLEACDAKWRELLNSAETKAAAFQSCYIFADKYREALVEVMVQRNLWDFAIHGGEPLDMILHLIDRTATDAVDPDLGGRAKNLYVRGVRAGAKKGRLQMQKLMQKSIDNQALTIQQYDAALVKANEYQTISRNAVRNVLNDKVGLKGVRKSIKQAIIVETGRLRAVYANQGV